MIAFVFFAVQCYRRSARSGGSDFAELIRSDFMAIACSPRDRNFCQTLLPMGSLSRLSAGSGDYVSEADSVGSMESERENVSKDINVVALVKGEERYIFLFNDGQKGETLRTLGKYASDSKLSFSWYDAAVLSQKVRNIEQSKSTSEVDVEGEELDRSSSSSDLFPKNHFGHEQDSFSPDGLFPEEDWF